MWQERKEEVNHLTMLEATAVAASNKRHNSSQRSHESSAAGVGRWIANKREPVALKRNLYVSTVDTTCCRFLHESKDSTKHHEILQDTTNYYNCNRWTLRISNPLHSGSSNNNNDTVSAVESRRLFHRKGGNITTTSTNFKQRTLTCLSRSNSRQRQNLVKAITCSLLLLITFFLFSIELQVVLAQNVAESNSINNTTRIDKELLPLADADAPTTSTITATLSSTTPTTTTVQPTTTTSEGSFNEETTNNLGTSNTTVVHKLKPVNFTLVHEMFEATLSEDEVAKKWKFMDSQLQDGMKSILKMLFPQIVALSQDAKVSGDCSGGILKWILSLRNLRSWAIKMLDATGKPTAGMFQGSLTMFGNYRQCLSIRAPDEDEIEITDQFEEYFRGQFCVIHLKPWMPNKKPFYHLNSSIDSLIRKNNKYYEKTLYDELADIAIAFNFIDIRMDLCVPSTCTVADIQRVADLLSKKLEMKSKVMRCDISPRDTGFFKQVDFVTYLWLIIPLTLIIISLVATFIVVAFTNRRHANEQFKNINSKSYKINQNKSSRLFSVIRYMSITNAFRNRLSLPTNRFQSSANSSGSSSNDISAYGVNELTSDQHDQSIQALNYLNVKPLPLYGLRNIFIFWFLIVQMTVELKYQYLRESLTLRDMVINYWPFQFLVNSTLLFDSIILITAFTYGYTCLEATLKDLITYLIDKYVRLILPIITVIAITIATPLLAVESPVWRNFVEEQSSVCQSTGYLNLFFLQNFISYDKICLPHTWLFCAELQLIVFSIPLVLLLKRTFLTTEDLVIIGRGDDFGMRGRTTSLLIITLKRLLISKAGILSLSFVVFGFLLNFYNVYINQLPPAWFYTFPDNSHKNYYFGQFLTRTWTHLSVFLIGLLGGHVCRSTLQLRSIKLLKTHNQQRVSSSQPPPQPSPTASGSTMKTDSTYSGSTSTIVVNETEPQKNDVSNNGIGSNNQNGRLKKASIQLAALACMLAIIFSTYQWSTRELPPTLVAAIYNLSTYLIWSISLVCIMIQLCLPDSDNNNEYSTLAGILSHPVCTFLGRLSFLVYLVSPYVQNFVLAVEEQSLFPSLFMMFHVIVGNIVLIYIIAFILSIVIEQPTRLVCRFFLCAPYDLKLAHAHQFATSDEHDARIGGY